MPTTTIARRSLSTRSITLCAIFAALTAVCSQLAIPLPLVPLNLALFSVYLSGALLGPFLGTLSQVVYLCVGLVGVPVFVGFRGGPSVLVGPTGGYLLGYLAAALITGLVARHGGGFWRLACGMLLGLTLCYTFGTVWFVLLTGKTLVAALSVCVLPFLPGDAVKIVAAAFLTLRLRGPLRCYLS